METHTCFIVDKLQNERSAGNNAWSSRKEVPEQTEEKDNYFTTSAEDKRCHQKGAWGRKLKQTENKARNFKHVNVLILFQSNLL